MQHWADGGPTDLNNLVLVCWRCHRDIHHTGKTPTRGTDGHWTLQRRRTSAGHDPPSVPS